MLFVLYYHIGTIRCEHTESLVNTPIENKTQIWFAENMVISAFLSNW